MTFVISNHRAQDIVRRAASGLWPPGRSRGRCVSSDLARPSSGAREVRGR